MTMCGWGLHKVIWVPEMPSSRDLSKPAAGNNTHTCLSQEHQTVVLVQLHVVGLSVCVCVFVCVCVGGERVGVYRT